MRFHPPRELAFAGFCLLTACSPGGDLAVESIAFHASSTGARGVYAAENL